eukprot:c42435_g1_i1.p1 GENE.c42435_g1_i1~~c42435_g1_i1.p1  ORF type:complete len:323 (+),score=86.42 c42435_g1_i1:3-971(+)
MKQLKDDEGKLVTEKADAEAKRKALTAAEERLANKLALLAKMRTNIDALGMSPAERAAVIAEHTATGAEVTVLEREVADGKNAQFDLELDIKLRKRKAADRKDVLEGREIASRHSLIQLEIKQHELARARDDLRLKTVLLQHEKAGIESQSLADQQRDLGLHIADQQRRAGLLTKALADYRAKAEGAAGRALPDDVDELLAVSVNPQLDAVARTLKLQLHVIGAQRRANDKRARQLADISDHLNARAAGHKQAIRAAEQSARDWKTKQAALAAKEKAMLEVMRAKGQNEIQAILQSQYEIGGLHPFIALKYLDLSKLDWMIE